ncbi:hypothetical protein Avbf_03753 [Armadillidium vulgare]|nr:hypothetical protein Avbf_03753 [Armadillidium vulgare]
MILNIARSAKGIISDCSYLSTCSLSSSKGICNEVQDGKLKSPKFMPSESERAKAEKFRNENDLSV